jgi:hypothetical protein
MKKGGSEEPPRVWIMQLWRDVLATGEHLPS